MMKEGKIFGVEELWQTLRKRNAIVMYGTGNGADKIICELDRRGIRCDGFFASDGFVRDRYFHGKRVMSLDEAEEKFGDFTVLMAFGSARKEVLENVKRIMAKHEFFAPDVPVAAGPVFDADFYNANKSSIDEARELFADETSVKTFDNVIKYKLSGDVKYLFNIEISESDAFDLLGGEYTAYIDCGAYNGDTVRKILDLYKSINKVSAFEPAKKPFEKLTAFCNGYSNVEFELFNACVSDRNETQLISDGGGRGSQLGADQSLSGAKKHEINCMTVDSAANYKGEKLLIKYDVEGEEHAALRGSADVIKNNDTELIVSLYHKSEDIFVLPKEVKALMPDSRIYLRKLPGLPAWDINLYVCSK